MNRRYLSFWHFWTDLDADPDAELVVFKALGVACRGQLGKAGNRLWRCHHKRLDLATLDRTQHRPHQRHHGKIKHAAHQVFQIRRQAVVGCMQAFGTRVFQSFFGHQMVKRADARGTETQGFVGLFGIRHKLLQRVDGQVFSDGNRNRRVAHECGHAHVFGLVLGGSNTQWGVDQLQRRTRQNGVAVGCGIGRFQNPQGATDAHHVFDNHRLAE